MEHDERSEGWKNKPTTKVVALLLLLVSPIGADACLPAELEAVETSVAQREPELPFNIGHVLPEPGGVGTDLAADGRH